MNGVLLQELHPVIANRSCDDCRKWMYDDDPDGDHQIVERIPGDPEPRGTAPTPCEVDRQKGCPKGHWSRPLSFSHKNREAYAAHCVYRSSGQPIPPDPVMMQNAMLIETSLQRIEAIRRLEMINAIHLSAMRRVQ